MNDLTMSVVIVAYNHLEEVLTCLTSLQVFASKTISIEFLIADDCSNEVFFPAVIPHCSAKVIRRPENGGFSANANTGASFAQGDIVFLVNQDILAIGQDANGKTLSQNWDIALMQAFDNPTVGIVGAKLLFPAEPLFPNGRIQSAGGRYDAHGQPFHRCLGYSNIEDHEVNTPETVSWVTGAALAIRKPLFEQVGGFDVGYVRGYFEDTSLCESVKALGYSVWYEPRCVLTHSVGTSGGNPLFMQNAKRFKETWVDTGKVKPDTYVVKAGWW